MKLNISRRPKIEYTEIVSQISSKLFKVTIKLTVKFRCRYWKKCNYVTVSVAKIKIMLPLLIMRYQKSHY